jgi:isopenicillin N synthase-like dioxygenase
MKVATGGRQNRGYVPLNSESSISTRLAKDAPAPADLKEAFAVGRLDAPPDAEKVAHADVQYEPNVWPNNPPEFKAAFEGYYTELERLALRMLPVFANALKVKEDFFSQFFSVHNCIMRSHIYPTQKVRPQPGQIRNGAHTDFGAFTLLSVPNKSGARGLQLLNSRDEWIDISPGDNAFIVNIADLMMAWTNDRWRSTLHRVVNPPYDTDENIDRFSISYFAHTNFDAVIECIPTCVEPDATPRHEPFLAGEHRQAKLKKLAMAE